MESEHCQLRVRGALGSVEGVTIDSTVPGEILISLENEAQYQAAVQAVERAGYTVEESEATTDTKDTLRFRTNINCGGCVAAVRPFLDEVAGTDQWEVDTADRDKLLSVRAGGITSQDVIGAVQRAGFRIEPVQD